MEQKNLSDLMTSDVESVTLKDNVYEAAVIMRDKNVGVVPVVDEQNHCIGLITDRDIVIRGIASKRSGSFAVEGVMSEKLVTGTPDMTGEQAAQIMAKEQIRRLPIVDNGKLVGIVSMADLAIHRETMDEAGFAISQISEPTTQHSQGYQQ